jgi:hypothetical protein
MVKKVGTGNAVTGLYRIFLLRKGEKGGEASPDEPPAQ